MTTAFAGTVADRVSPPGSRSARDWLFTSFGLLSTLLGLVALGALLYDVVSDGAGRLSWQFMTSYHVPARGGCGHLRGAGRQPVRHCADGGYRRPARRRRRGPPGGVRRARPAVAPYRDQHREPGRRAVDHLRPARAWTVRARHGNGTERAGWRLTLALLVLPVVILSTREALRAVPSSLREGSYALGATKWQTIWNQVLPAALPGHPDRPHPRAVARHRRNGTARHDRRADLRSVRARRHLVALHRAPDSGLQLGLAAAGRRSPRTPPRASSSCSACC